MKKTLHIIVNILLFIVIGALAYVVPGLMNAESQRVKAKRLEHCPKLVSIKFGSGSMYKKVWRYKCVDGTFEEYDYSLSED
jgi:hypothetical protein